MRRRRSEIGRFALLASLLFATRADAQSGSSSEGALFLLFPVGARAAAMGNAVAGVPLAGESVWGNPGGLGSIGSVEFALHHSESLIGISDAVSIAIPFRVLGVFALSASTVNFGEQEVGGLPGFPEGRLVPRSVVLGASYATTLGNWVNAGLTYKLVQLRADCSGSCPGVETTNANTSAIDFGLQVASASHPLSYGLSVTNVGPRLQVIDREQADPLPSRLHFGVRYRVSALEKSLEETTLHIATELTDRLRIAGPTLSIGAELSYQSRFFLRGGYVDEEGAGIGVGGGAVAGNLVIDIGRVITGVSADAGVPPTYISLKYRFK